MSERKAPAWFRALAGLVGRDRLAGLLGTRLPVHAPRLRMFAAARPGRLNEGWSTLTTSADSESVSSLAALRARSRALVRDNAHAKRAREIVVNNVIGTGVGLQAAVTSNRANPVTGINDAIESAWSDWSRAESCHTGGTLHFADLERLVMGEVFEAGEAFIRIHRAGPGAVPLSLEIIEPERLADEWEVSVAGANLVRQGVEVDAYHRPIAYWLHEHHPGDPRRGAAPDRLLRIPAQDILHLRPIARWPQVRGVPMMHAAMSRLNQLGEFQDAAVAAARLGAEKVMILKENEDGRLAETLADGEQNDGTLTWSSGAGTVDILPSGTDLVDWSPEYPHANYEPFVRAALRDVAAAFGVSYESLSRDYSQSNYSSSRLALLDDRDGWRVLQQWYIRNFREPLHRLWLETAVYARAIRPIGIPDYVARPDYYRAVTWKPRGWSWVDPTKEVAAYKEAELAGYITKGDIIAATGNGRDLEDVIRDRRRELDLLAAAEIETDTTHAAPDPMPAAPDPDAEDDTAPARLYAIKRDRP